MIAALLKQSAVVTKVEVRRVDNVVWKFLGRPKRRLGHNIKTNLREVGCRWAEQLRGGYIGGLCY